MQKIIYKGAVMPNLANRSRATTHHTLLGQSARIAIAVALLTLSAKVQVPFWLVPMTLQVAAVLTIAATMGFRLGTASFGAYLAAGVAGLPVFAGTPEKGIGLAYMVGPTGGYLAGFFIATALVGLAADRLPRLAILPAMLAGLAAIYAAGLAWLATFVPASKLLAAGFTPFIAGDLVKLVLAATIALSLPVAWRTKIKG